MPFPPLTVSSHSLSRLQLPKELLIDIFSRLNFHDLLALRLISHSIHNLIHKNESTIVRQNIHFEPELEVMQRFQKPAGPLTLDYRINLHHCHRACRQISTVLAGRCCEKLKTLRSSTDDASWRERKTKILADELMTGIFALHEFFAQLGQIVIRSLRELQGLSTTDVAQLGSILGVDQQRILETFPQKTLIRALQAWRILKGVAFSKGLPLNLRDTISSYMSVKMVLVLGGLDRFGELISETTPVGRKRNLHTFHAEIWDFQHWKLHQAQRAQSKSINHLAGPPKRVSASDFASTTLRKTAVAFIDGQQICGASLEAVILRAEGTLSAILSSDQYIGETIREAGDPSFQLLRWYLPDNAA